MCPVNRAKHYNGWSHMYSVPYPLLSSHSKVNHTCRPVKRSASFDRSFACKVSHVTIWNVKNGTSSIAGYYMEWQERNDKYRMSIYGMTRTECQVSHVNSGMTRTECQVSHVNIWNDKNELSIIACRVLHLKDQMSRPDYVNLRRLQTLNYLESTILTH